MDEQNRKGNEVGLACREKYWSELNADERIERMREQVKRMQYALGEAMEIARKAVAIAKEHQHASSGAVLVPVANRHDGQLTGCGDTKRVSNPNEVYF